MFATAIMATMTEVLERQVLEVLAEPSRRRILDLLLERDHAVGELVDALAMRQPSVSKHLKVLRSAGLVTVRPEAQRRVYCLRAAPLQELDEWLTPYRRAWAGRLDALERHLDALDALDALDQPDPLDLDPSQEDPT